VVVIADDAGGMESPGVWQSAGTIAGSSLVEADPGLMVMVNLRIAPILHHGFLKT